MSDIPKTKIGGQEESRPQPERRVKKGYGITQLKKRKQASGINNEQNNLKISGPMETGSAVIPRKHNLASPHFPNRGLAEAEHLQEMYSFHHSHPLLVLFAHTDATCLLALASPWFIPSSVLTAPAP